MQVQHYYVTPIPFLIQFHQQIILLSIINQEVSGMLLFSTLLNIKPSMTKKNFIDLVIEWNQTSTYHENIIDGLVWNNETDIRFGDENLWLHIVDHEEKNITAVRYNKTTTENGIVWTTDYIMNFNDHKMSIRLDRSYQEEALMSYTQFSTPHFITLLIRHGYLEDDHDLPVIREPYMITEENLKLLGDVINGYKHYNLPVIYVSRTYYDEDPVDIGLLASRVKGIAHVFAERSTWLDRHIKDICSGQNEYYGAIGIYYPNESIGHRRYLYHAESGYDVSLMEKVRRAVMEYSNLQLLDPLYSWQGVSHSLLSSHLNRQIEERRKAEEEKQQTTEETEALLEVYEQDYVKMKEQFDELSRINQAQEAELMGLRRRISSTDSQPLIYMGQEAELFHDEIREIIMDAIDDNLKNTQTETRRYDVLKDILDHNEYPHRLREIHERLKTLMTGYKTMTAPMRQELMDMGFDISEDGKHYKLTYRNDPRYYTTISKSGSDHREGKNIVSKITRTML